MHKLAVMYPNEPDVRFDFGYYTGTHDRLVKKLLVPYGLDRIEVDRGLGAPGDEAAPYVAVATLWFKDAVGIEEGLAEHGEELLADVPNFSSVEPTLQISEVVAGG